MQQIADHFHYSRARLSAIFKDVTGQGVNEAVTDARMRKAKKLLAEGKLSVTRIAGALGYCSSQYFSTKFTKEIGCSPTEYAKSVR